MPESFDARDTCWKCRRAQRVCLCSRVRPFEIDPLLVVLIHPKESKKTIGTARLVKLSVTNSLFWQGEGPDFDQDPKFLKLVEDPSLFPVVLFPGPESVNLSQPKTETTPEWLPKGRRLAIFVIDGSWSLARKLIRTSQVLKRLRRVSFEVSTPSGYQFRKQPRPYCLSTVEAVHLLIENLHRGGYCALPAENAHHAMLETFDWIVQSQLQFYRENGKRTEGRRRPSNKH